MATFKILGKCPETWRMRRNPDLLYKWGDTSQLRGTGIGKEAPWLKSVRAALWDITIHNSYTNLHPHVLPCGSMLRLMGRGH